MPLTVPVFEETEPVDTSHNEKVVPLGASTSINSVEQLILRFPQSNLERTPEGYSKLTFQKTTNNGKGAVSQGSDFDTIFFVKQAIETAYATKKSESRNLLPKTGEDDKLSATFSLLGLGLLSYLITWENKSRKS